MRSGRRSRGGRDRQQESLFDVPAADPPPPREGRTATGGQGRLLHRLGGDALASRGMPAGTELVVEPARSPRRGHVMLVRTGGRLRVGVFEVELGRAVLRSDLGSVWLDHRVEFVGVVTVVNPPLDGLGRIG